MPITVTISKRHIARTEANQEILDLWDECEISILPEEERQKILDESNVKKLKGNLAYIKRWFDKHDIHITDAGQNILLKELALELDYRAYVLYTRFNYFLNDVAIQIGKNPTMDAGIANPKKPIDEPYALIKTILLRMVLRILHNKGGKNEICQNHEKVFNKFIENLANTSINLNQGWASWFKGENGSKFSSSFLSRKDEWSCKISSMIGEVELINVVKNVVESNLEALIKLQLHTTRYLYFRLLNVLDIKIGLEERDYFNDDWIIKNLPDAEQEIMNLYPVKASLSLSKDDNVSSGILVTKERQAFIIDKLEELKNLKKIQITDVEIKIILCLYKALYNLTFVINVVGSIDTLTTFTGCLPFLMKYIDAKELDRYITKFRDDCLNACTVKGLEKTIIHTLTSKNNTKDFMTEKLPFRLLDNKEILESMSESIMALFTDLTMRCKTHECDSIINENNQFLLPSNTNKLSTVDKHIRYLIKNDEPKNTLLACLDFEYNDLLKLFNYLQDEKNDAWKHVGQEAYLTLQNKKLPLGLRDLVKNIFDITKYQEPFEKLQTLANELRVVFRVNNEGILPKNNIDLIDFAVKKTFPYLDKYRERIKQCRNDIRQCNTSIVMAATKDKNFVLAYFQHKYLNKLSDLEYIPHMPTTIKAIAEFRQWKIIINNDESNSANDPIETIHVDYDSNTRIQKPSIPQIISPEPVVSEIKNTDKIMDVENEQISVVNNDNTELNSLIFEAMHTFTHEQKKNLLNFFVTDDPLIAEHGWEAANNMVESAKKSIQSVRENGKDLEGYIISDARRKILSGMLTFLQLESQPETHSEFINKTKKHFEDSINNYIEKQLPSEYQKISSEFKLQSLIYSNDYSMLLLQEINNITDQKEFLAFTQDSHSYYMKNENGEYISFHATKGPGDGNCSLTSLDINDRSEFVATIKEALKNPRIRKKARKLLGLEIRNDFDGKNGIQGIHDQKEWLELYDIYNSYCLEADSLKRKINARGFNCSGTVKDLIVYLNKPEIQSVLTEEDVKSLNELAKLIENIQKSENGLVKYCRDPLKIDIYLEKLSIDKCWIGKYALHVYAHQKNFCLYIYDKQNTKSFQEIKLDKNTSLALEYPSNNKRAYIVFINGNHFDKLQLRNELAPNQMANGYMDILRENIKKNLSGICIPGNNQNREEYVKSLENKRDISMNEIMNLTSEEAENYAANLALIEKSQKWAEILEARELIYKQMENQLGSHFPKITKLKNQMILIDEVRHNNKSLLYHFIENGITEENEDMIDFILNRNASVVSQNGDSQDFIVETNKTKNCCMYVLEKNDNNQWTLKYYETAVTQPLVINIDDIPGLKELLQDTTILDSSIKQNCKKLLAPYHEKIRIKSPLSFAARNMGFYHENPLYFKLLSSAFKEALIESDKTLGSDYPIMYHFSAKFIPAILEHLDWYAAKIKKDRRESFWYRLCVDNFPRENQSRSRDLALIYESTIHALKTHEYKDMLLTLIAMKNNAASTSGSELYLNLDGILNVASNWLSSYLSQFNAEYESYHISENQNYFSELLNKSEMINIQKANESGNMSTITKKTNKQTQRLNENKSNLTSSILSKKSTYSSSGILIFSPKSTSKNTNPDITKININGGPGHG